MAEVRYSINGKYFKDFGVYITESDGLIDQLKRKTVNSYDWAEYHGLSVDLSNPKFEAREITLKGYVMGADWLTMKTNFDAIVGEFQKSGTQRLLIEPLGLKPMPFEVYADGGATLAKRFRQGRTVGTFTLKMIEPNPIKKVLYFIGNTLNLAYNCPSETELFYIAGMKETAKGNVSLSGKNIPNRNVSAYHFEGRNLLTNSHFSENKNEWLGVGLGETLTWSGSEKALLLEADNNSGGFYQLFFSVPGSYVLSFDVKPGFQSGAAPYQLYIVVGGASKTISIHSTSTWQRYSVVFDSLATNSTCSIQALGNQKLYFRNIKLERGATATPYAPRPEEQKFIIIAGNVDEITALTTNATVLWEKL